MCVWKGSVLEGCTCSAGQWWEGPWVMDGDELGGAAGLALGDGSLPGLGHWRLPYLSLGLHLHQTHSTSTASITANAKKYTSAKLIAEGNQVE